MSRSILFLIGLAALALSVATVAPVQAQETDADAAALESLLEAPVSAAAKYEQSARNAAASVTVITAEEIARHGYQTLAEALAQVRGFYVTDDRQYSYLGVRGFGAPTQVNSRVLILIDGHTMNESVSGYAPINENLGLDLSLVERIEVIRGPGSALYGTGAMFAVINVVTKAADDLPALATSVEAGSYGHRRVTATATRSVGTGDVLLSGYWSERDGQDLYFEAYDDPATNHGVAEGMDWSRRGGLTAHGSWGPLRFRGNYAFADEGLPTGVGQMAFNDDRAQHLTHVGFAELAMEHAFAFDKQLEVRLFGDLTDLEATYPIATPLPHDPAHYATRVLGLGAGTRTVGSEAQFIWDTGSANRLVVGAEYRRAFAEQDAGSDFVSHMRGSADYGHFGAFVQDEYRFTSTLAAVVGLRHDYYSTVGGTFTPRAALIYNPALTSTFKLLYGEAYRAPGLWELYYSDYGQLQNTQLTPERVRTVEAVWDQQIVGGLASTISVFHYALDDVIVLVPTGSGETGPTGDPIVQNRNVGGATTLGAEAELNARLGSDASGYLSYAYAHTHDELTGRTLVNSPAHLAKAGLRLPVSRFVLAAFDARYESRRLSPRGTHTDGFLLADLTLSTPPLAGHVVLRGGVRNVLDATYHYPVSRRHRQNTLQQDGRTFFAEIRFRL